MHVMIQQQLLCHKGTLIWHIQMYTNFITNYILCSTWEWYVLQSNSLNFSNILSEEQLGISKYLWLETVLCTST